MMEHLAYSLYRTTVGIITLLPTSLVAHLGYLLGRVLSPLLPAYQRLILTNLDLAFGNTLSPQQKRDIQKRHFALLCSNILAGVNLAGRPVQQSLERTHIEGLDRLLAILKSGRGVLALMTHSSNWELVAKLSPILFKTACAAVYQPLRNPRIDRHIRKQRKAEGLQLFDRRRLAGVSAVLRTPGVVGVLADQHAGRGGVWCPLFGRITSTSPLIPILAKGTNAAVLSISVETTSIGHWKISFSPEIPIDKENVESATATLNHAIEHIVQKAPHDWFWSHDRWKTRKPIQLLHSLTRRHVITDGARHPYRILFASPDSLPNATLCLPATHALLRGRPDAELVIVCPPTLLSFWQDHLPQASILPISLLSQDHLASQLKTLHADAALCLHHAPSFLRAARIAKIPRITHPTSFPKPLRNRNPLTKPSKSAHLSPPQQALQLLEHVVHLGGPGPTDLPPETLPLQPDPH